MDQAKRTTLLMLASLPLARVARAAAPTPEVAAEGEGAARTDVVSLLGNPHLPPGFAHFPYVNPDAPKGGEVTLAAIGSFDSFNPFIVRGTPADGLDPNGGTASVWDALLRPSADEASTAYAHLAESVEVHPDHLGVAFTLRREARFHDGKPVTAADVAWTFNTLRSKGRPFYQAYYADIAGVETKGDRRVVFRFKSARNRELPLILGQMAILPAHWWQGRDFASPLTDPPLGSGPYRVGHFEFSRTVAYDRVPDYWAANLPTGKGLANFGRIRHEYFRDASVAMEAFKAGQIDFRNENIAKNWATGYDFPAVHKGLVKRETIRHHLPTGMQGFAMNTRRPVFSNRLVRQALAWAFDFEWENKNLFYGAYTRTLSYFSNSDLACSGLPQGAELALLEPYRAQLPPELFTRPFTLPVTDGSGNNRKQLMQSLKLLEQAGWKVQHGKLAGPDGQPMRFEILLDSPSYERVALPYVQSLKRLGITATVRTVDPAQYQRLVDNFNFDMTMTVIPESDRPGNEQLDYWSCAAAKSPGSGNLMGVCSPVVDALVQKVIQANDAPSLRAATHALDRVLLWGWYIVPQWHLDSFRIAFWNRFGRPSVPVRAGYVFDAWWIDKALATKTDAARGNGQ